MDGARLFLARPYTGIPPETYAALFDTVYVSLYKYFNAAGGAVLAGPRHLLENLYHQRRMFGGGTITSAGSAPGAWEVAPDLERILGEALFGTIWCRDALSPVPRDEITAKFMSLAGSILGDATARKIVDVIEDLGALEDVGSLTAMLVP